MAGDFLHISGENGTGKSTALAAFMGRYPHYSGTITRHYDEERLAYLPQMGNAGYLLPFSLGEVIRLSVPGNQPRFEEKIAALGLLAPEDLDLAWNASSGGERQKALLSKAFLADADLIILDEPFNHLDAPARKQVVALIADVCRQGSAVIAVSHDSPALTEQATVVLHTGYSSPTEQPSPASDATPVKAKSPAQQKYPLRHRHHQPKNDSQLGSEL